MGKGGLRLVSCARALNKGYGVRYGAVRLILQGGRDGGFLDGLWVFGAWMYSTRLVHDTVCKYFAGNE
jgi:hypothetical protein